MNPRLPSRPDRRVDTESRQRIVNLEDRNHRMVNRVVFAIALMAGTLVLSIGAQTYLFVQQQSSRERVLRLICEARNRDHEAIRRFVTERNPGARSAVEKAFPLEADCAAFAHREVDVERGWF